MAPSNPPPPTKGGGIMRKKIGPIPVPIAIGLVAIVGFLAYRHFKSSVSTVATNPSQTGTDTTGTASPGGDLSNPGVGSGTGDGSVGMSIGDLEGLLSALQGLGATNYYYGSGAGGSTLTGSDTGAVQGNPPQVTTVSTSSAPAPSSSDQTTGGSAGPALQYQPPAPTAPPSSGLGIIQQEEGYGGPPAPVSDIIAAQTVGQDYLASIAPNTHLGVATTPVIVNPMITANPTGGSANKKQGVYSVH